jgi:hypothetical protein
MMKADHFDALRRGFLHQNRDFLLALLKQDRHFALAEIPAKRAFFHKMIVIIFSGEKNTDFM